MAACSIRQNVIDTMLEKDVMSFDENISMFRLKGPAYKFNDEARRLQTDLEATYGIQTEPVVYLHDVKTRGLRGNSAYRDNIVSSTLVRFRGSEIEKFQEKENETEIDEDKFREATEQEVEESESRLVASVEGFLDAIGVEVRSASRVKNPRTGEEMEVDAVADLLQKTVDVLEGNRDNLPEEAAHFFVNILKDLNSSFYRSMRSRIFDLPQYQMVVESYSNLKDEYGSYDDEGIIDEAIAQVILSKFYEDPSLQDRETRWWKRALQYLKKLFNIGDPFVNSAYEMLNGDFNLYKEVASRTTNPRLFYAVGEQANAQTIKEKLIAGHRSLEIKEFERDQLEGKVDNLELFEDEDGVVLRYQRTLPDGTTETVSKRATDAASISFARSMGGLARVKKLQKSKRSEISRSTGTSLHGIGQYLIEKLTEKMEGMNLVDLGHPPKNLEVLKKEIPGMTDAMVDEFRGEMTKLLESIKEIQDSINKKNGTEADVEVFTEVRMYDPETDTAGTVDVMFLFSDGSSAIYDFKFVHPKNKYTTGVGSNRHIDIDPFRGGKREGYDSQLSFYTKASLLTYGITNVRRSRIIPGHIGFKWKDDTPVSLETFHMGAEKNRFLSHISLASEYTEDKKINRKLEELYAELDKLNRMESSAKVRRDKDIIYAAIQGLTVDSNFSKLIEELNYTLEKVGGYYNIRDEESEDYMSIAELFHSLEILTLFDDLKETVLRKAKEIQEKDPESYKKFSESINTVEESIKNTIDILDEEILYRMDEGIGTIKSRFETERLSPATGKADMLIPMDQIDNFVFKETKRRLDIVHDIIARRTEALRQKWIKLDDELKSWEKTNGRSPGEAYDLLIKEGKDELSLIPMFKKEFWDEVRSRTTDIDSETDQNANREWMRKHFRIKEDAKESYEKALKRKTDSLKIEYPNKGKAYETKLKEWKDTFNVFGGNPRAWTSSKYWMYLEIKPDIAPTVWSKEYAFINRPDNKALLDYYTAWRNQLRNFNEELEGVYLPGDKIFNIRAGLIEKAAGGSFNLFKGKFDANMLTDWMSKGWVVKSEEDDHTAGEPLTKIPLPGINPLRDSKGNINPGLVSKDLSRSMYLMGASIYNYMEKSAIESELLFLRRQLHSDKLSGKQLKTETTSKGVELKRDASGKLLTEDLDPNTLTLYDSLFNYYLYGHSYSEKDSKIPITGGSAQKAISKLNSIFSMMKLAAPIKIAISARVAASVFSTAEAAGGIHYNSDNRFDAAKLFITDRKTYMAIADYFNLHAEGQEYHSARKLHSSALARQLDSSRIYEPLGMTDRDIDRAAGMSMMFSHGLDEKGEVKHLRNLPEGTKPLIDVFKDKVVENSRGEMSIPPGTLEDVYFTMFRQRMKRVISGQKGDQSNENIVAARTTMAGKLLGTFKWWAPGIVHKRWKSVYYDYIEDMTTEGRYKGLIKGIKANNEYAPAEDQLALLQSTLLTAKNLFTHLTMLQSYNISKERRDSLIAKDQWSDAKQERYEKEREAIRLEFEWMKSNSNDPDFQRMDLENYIMMREASVRSGLVEVRAIMIFQLMTLLLGARGYDDDDERGFGATYTGNKLNVVLSKILLEIGFAMNPLELVKLNKSAIPVLGMVGDAERMISALRRDLYNVATGKEKDKRTRSFMEYFAKNFIVGYNQMSFLWEDHKPVR